MGASGPDAPLLFDLTGRGEIALGGKDRVAFLQGLVTNDVKALRPGQGAPAALLSAKGKLVAVMAVLCREDELILDTEPELAAPLEALLKKYLFFQEVTIENRTEQRGVLHLMGNEEGTGDSLRRVIGLDPPSVPFGHVDALLGPLPSSSFEEGSSLGLPACIVLEARGGPHGFDIRIDRPARSAALSLFEASGLVPSPLSLLESARIEAGIPRWGAELTADVLPDEAGLPALGWVSYTKGCYIGQEVVARIRTYGHVNRHLVGLLFDGPVPPAAGDEIRAEGTRTGRVTSATLSPRLGRAVGLGYVRREHAAPGAPLSVLTREGERSASATLLAQPSGAGRPSR